ncbi:MAG: ion channel [Pseudomonadota bacterium]
MTVGGQIALGFSWTCVTIGLAVAFILVLMEGNTLALHRLRRWPAPARTGLVLLASVIWMLVGIVAVVSAWAWLFVTLAIFDDAEAGFYFAIVSTTTVGFGDVVLPQPWRILSGFAAADGFIIFGLDTAVLFEVLRLLREAELPRPA